MAWAENWPVINQDIKREDKILNDVEIKNRIIEMIASYQNVNIADILLEKEFEQLNINSIEFVGLVVQCEKEFGISFEDDKLLLEEFPNLESFLSYIITLYNRMEINA